MLENANLFLQEAERHQYAVEAFNVYNLEAVAAVIAAAEAEKSPAILQVRLFMILFLNFYRMV